MAPGLRPVYGAEEGLLLQPAHHLAQLGTHLLDGVGSGHAAHSQEVSLAAAVGIHLGEELGGKGAGLDLLEDLAHLLAGILGDQAAPDKNTKKNWRNTKKKKTKNKQQQKQKSPYSAVLEME